MKGIHISRVIFDEVHMLKLSKDKRNTQEKKEKTPYIIDKISASFYWFISASPSDIRNNIYRRSGFFNTSLYEVLELGSGACFKNTNNLISQKIILPDPITHIVSCKNTAILNVLSSVVNNSILESISADDVNGAIQKLGVEKLESDSIISLVNKDLLRKKDMILSHIKELHTKIWKNENSKLKSIESYELKLKEIDKKIELIRKRILDSNIDPITCDDIITPAVTPCCQNTFEFKSLTSYLIKEKTSCPMCRSPLHPSQLLIIQNKSTINGKEEDIVDVLPSKNIVFSSKLEALTNILSTINKNTKNNKIIISSGQTANYTDVFNVISNFKMSMRKLEGTIFTRNKVIDQFKNGDLQILYIPAYEAGSGLNLVNANHMILLHTMSEGYTKQIIGSSQRLGRTEQLTIWKILYEDELNRLSS